MLFRNSERSAPNEILPTTPIAPDEPIARFVLKEDRIRWLSDSPIGRIREKQFEPDKRNELSVFRVVNLEELSITDLGQKAVVSEKQPNLIGWGQFDASLVAQAFPGLHLDPTPDLDWPTHPRHANIKGWPNDADLDDRKSKQILIKQFFSEKAQLILTTHGKQIEAQKKLRRQ
jgi:hypothetical protein